MRREALPEASNRGMVRSMPSPEQPREKPSSGDIQAGDTVAYSHKFLQSIGVLTGEMPRAKGRVEALVPVGRELTLAEIEWDQAELPKRVNVKNLCKVESVAFYD
jgi:hypothetical protein